MLDSAPSEILDHIFTQLSPTDLQNVRLVCHSFSLLAARQLFCEVFVWPNQQCLQNLNHIVSHSTFRQYVKSVVYSEKVLPVHRSYREWFDHLDPTSKSLNDLGDYHDAYEFQIEYQNLLRADGVLKSNMTRALALMPNLTNVLVNPCLQDDRQDRASELRVARETLHQPRYDGGDPWQVTNIFQSLYDSGRQIKLLKGFALQLTELDNPSSRLDCLGRQLRHLALCSRYYWSPPTYGFTKLGQVLKEALVLETLELVFFMGPHPQVFFRQLWPTVIHYCSLTRLFLCGLRTSQNTLTNFLTLHAPTLRSLKLSDIEFGWKKVRGEICVGSWTAMIHFLQQHMNLTNVALDSYLSNRWNQAWFSRYNDEPSNAPIDDGPLCKPMFENTLRYRIEKYVLEGGDCPLDVPRGREHEDPAIYWSEIEDHTWVFQRRRGPDFSNESDDE